MKKNGWNMKPGQRPFGIITRLCWKQSNGEGQKEGKKEGKKEKRKEDQRER